ncbi:MAG: hypothetical protein Q7R41_08535, partial [Phycisphaerales bacterium]|nr:hypothetical protein [Phycisphaerales bacterium]
HVPKGSRARLLREGYIGAANIQIVPSADPNRAAGPVIAGEVIEFLPNRGVAELIDEFKIQVTPTAAATSLSWTGRAWSPACVNAMRWSKTNSIVCCAMYVIARNFPQPVTVNPWPCFTLCMKSPTYVR